MSDIFLGEDSDPVPALGKPVQWPQFKGTEPPKFPERGLASTNVPCGRVSLTAM